MKHPLPLLDIVNKEKVRKYIREQEKMDRDQQGQQYLEINNEF